MNFVPAVTDHFCMAQPSAFTQPGDRLLAEPCLCYGLMNASLIVPRWLFFLARRREGRISGSLHVARRGTRGDEKEGLKAGGHSQMMSALEGERGEIV